MNLTLGTLDQIVFGNSLSRWSVALGTALLILVGTTLARRIARRHYTRLMQTEEVELIEVPLQVIARTSTLFLCVLSLFGGLAILDVTDRVQNIAQKALAIAVFWQIGLWVATAAIAWIELKQRHSAVTDRAVIGTLSIIAVVVRGLIWSVVLLLTLDNLGVDITTLVAGLGIGGIAIALAVQNVLGDLLASLSIALDKPFVVGDFLIVDDFMGSVEYIGIKSTRLRSLSGEQIVMSNADLLASRVRNYGRMQERRVIFTIGVTYETPRAVVEEIPGIIRDIVNAQDNVRFDRCHFAKYGAASLDYETVYYVLSADYNHYMDIQQNINFQLFEAFGRRGIEFAYPTQKLWLAQVAAS
ncbi:MAG: mechanosensitive ion channel family protein [Steroidobacteraceae bacterium]